MSPSHLERLEAQPIAEVPRAQKSLLRLNTCGSVSDGKSTLIDRLLVESKALFGVERAQGIALDVAHRCFSTKRRHFIAADTPGHEQYTRNLATGAAIADVSLILVDARKGLLTQTRRDTLMASLLGIRQVVLVANKMDLVGYSEEVFVQLEAEYRRFATRIGLSSVSCIPISATNADNIGARSQRTPWYTGPTLLQLLDTLELDQGRLDEAPLRLPIQRVNQAGADFRGLAGTIVAGSLRPGDSVRVQPAGRTSRVARIATSQGDVAQARAGQAVTITLDDEVDVSRGDLVSSSDNPAEVADQFEATIIWLSESPLLRGRSYLMKLGPSTATATISPIKYKINVDTLEHAAAPLLDLNEIGVCNLELDRPIAYEAYAASRDLGGFILIDRVSNDAVGAGMLRFALRRAHNVHWQAIDVDKRARAAIKLQKPCVLWYTGFSGAGKSAIANLVDKRLHGLGRHGYLLDGDNVRHGLNKDLGFTAADRVENIRRIAEVAKLMVDAGLIVSTAFISPFQAERSMARALFEAGEFVEIFIDTPLAVAENRDPKGLYKKARRGELKNFTGIDSPYEKPENPEIAIDTVSNSAEQAAEEIIAFLQSRGLLT